MRVGINRFCEDGHIKVELSTYKSVRLGSFDSTVSGISLPTEMQISGCCWKFSHHNTVYMLYVSVGHKYQAHANFIHWPFFHFW